METFEAWEGELEIRRRGGARILRGRFPYKRQATVKSSGRTRKERIGPDAFGWQLREFKRLHTEELPKMLAGAWTQAQRELLEEQLERRNVHILAGHDFNKPLGDMKRGTARVSSSSAALDFEVDLPDEDDMPSYFLDVVKEVRTNRVGGVSPGFRVPPRSVVPNAEIIEPEPGNPGVGIRVINAAVLHEISIVSRPAYASTDVDLRAEDLGLDPVGDIPDLRPRIGFLWL